MSATLSATLRQPSETLKAAAKAPSKKRRSTRKRRLAAALLARMERNVADLP